MSQSVGNSYAGKSVEVVELSSSSKDEQRRHQQLLLEIKAQQHAFSVDVPTLPHDVRKALRSLGLPVRLFGENLANVRDRLRMELARRDVLEKSVKDEFNYRQQNDDDDGGGGVDDIEEEITKYSRASSELVRAREVLTNYSFSRTWLRLERERNYRRDWQRKRKARLNRDNSKVTKESVSRNFIDSNKVDEECLETYENIKKIGLEGSQYGDNRPISCIATNSSNDPIIATGSWSGTIKLWNKSLNLISQKETAHEDRIMGIAFRPHEIGNDTSNNQPHNMPSLLATSSIDLTAKLWKLSSVDGADLAREEGTTLNVTVSDCTLSPMLIQEVAHLKGHASRLCKVEFHPGGDYVVTTSHDHTWRLWDVETGGEILLQDGHYKEVYGIGFHPDGSLCATTDYGGIVHLWDIRTGKSVHHFTGHAKRILCAEFSPNGFQIATAGDDGFIKVWDLRKRKLYASVPAHSRLVTQLKFEKNDRSQNDILKGEFLVSSSFDCTAKVWSSRNFKMLNLLRGHGGKVTGVGILGTSRNSEVVTCGFDKTVKLWT